VSDIAYRADASAATAALPAAEPRDYVALLKPRVMSLVVFTGFAGLVVAPGDLHWLLGAVAVLCIAVGAGAAGAINMWYDRDIDAVMERTRGRPIPGGRIAPEEALTFGVVLAFASVFLMALAVNFAAAGLLALSILFYVFVYTMWLKRRTPQNIVIGGAAGAFPPMIGWAAVTGNVGIDAFLGACAVPLRRLRGGRGADAAGGRRRARNPAANSDLHAAARSGVRHAGANRIRRLDLRNNGGGAWRGVHRRGDFGLVRRDRPVRKTDVRLFHSLPVRAVRVVDRGRRNGPDGLRRP
jgi:hypothetical protein